MRVFPSIRDMLGCVLIRRARARTVIRGAWYVAPGT